MIHFLFKSDGSDGLLLIDKANLPKLTGEHLAALDILLDREGETELRFDFPQEAWSDVWNRESASIRDFLNRGNGFIALVQGGDHVCGIRINNDPESETVCKLHLPTGDLIGVSAGEVIQCLSNPELEMDVPFQENIEPGWYWITHESGLNFCLARTLNPSESSRNVLWL
jgi:hypothetical protein